MKNKTKLEWPPADEGAVYLKMQHLIQNGNFVGLENQITVKEMQKLIPIHSFIKIATCVLNIPENFPGSSRCFIGGKDYSKKLVDYVPIPEHRGDWRSLDNEWIYCIVYDKYVVKIGMTSSGLANRFSSYNAGSKDAMRKGTCATTNFVISECNYLALRKNMSVKIFAYKIPVDDVEIEVFGKKVRGKAKIAHIYEKTLLDKVLAATGKLPVLCGYSK